MSVFPIVISFDKKYVIPALITIKSILNNCSDTSKIEFFVLYKHLDKTLIQLVERVVFSFGSVVSFIDCSSFLEKQRFSNNENRPLETYFPLFIPTLFKDFSRVLSIDVDVLVRDDILKIIQELPSDKKLGGVRCMIRNYRKYDDYGDFNKFSRNVLGLADPCRYINSGLVLFNMDAITASDSLYCIECINKKWPFYDESILNHVFRESLYNFEQCWNFYAEYVDTNYLDFEPDIQQQVKEAQDNASIFHFVADTKPWDHPEPETTSKYRLEYRELVASVKEEIRQSLPKVICGFMWDKIDKA